MHNVNLNLLAAAALGAVLGAAPAHAQARGDYEVAGVEAEDLLKMRTGPGVNYGIVAGFPNGTVLRVQSCERSGNTSWCRVSLKQARALKGFVSSAYLRKMSRGER